MNAHKATITSIFDGTTLIEIPFFQRSYVWDKYLWERFLNDMEFTVTTTSTPSPAFASGRRVPAIGAPFTVTLCTPFCTAWGFSTRMWKLS